MAGLDNAEGRPLQAEQRIVISNSHRQRRRDNTVQWRFHAVAGGHRPPNRG